MYPKETVEAAKAVIALAGEIAKLAKDGVTFADAIALAGKLQEEPLKSLIAAAQENANLIPGEVQQLDVVNGLKAVLDIAPEVIALIEQLGQKQA